MVEDNQVQGSEEAGAAQVDEAGQADNPAPQPDSTVGLVERAEAAVKGLDEKLNAIQEATAKFEALAARMTISGRSQAGNSQKTKEEQEADEIQKGVDDMMNRFFPHRK